MSKFYFNHSCFTDKKETEVKCLLIETVNMIKSVREKGWGLYFSNRFWSTPISSGTLRSYLYSLNNQDKVRVIIASVMDLGPYFEEESPDSYPIIRVDPEVENGIIGYGLLCICFYNLQTLILSTKETSHLEHEQYFLQDGDVSLEIKNIIGESGLINYFQYAEPFLCIEDVFERIVQNSKYIVLLDSAKKSAKRHDFQKLYIEICRVILALEEIELSLLKKGVSEEDRKEIFLKQTGYEISGESKRTIQTPKFRREREFNIPSKGKRLFEWHIKIGRTTRIHYYVDEEDEKVYIGHCGCHLGIPSYNS